MSINGGIKFFELSNCLSVDGATIVASTGSASSLYCLDKNPDTYWRSIASSDATSETLEITLSDSTVMINRILLVDHNFKDFNIQYYSGGIWTQFSSVVGLDASKTNITETAFADGTAYYEFASVTTSKILITINKTQVANAQKFISQVIVTSELGTFIGRPAIKKLTVNKSSRVSQTLSGKVIVMKSIETAATEIEFKDYPRSSTYNVDIDLALTLHDKETAFLVWLCGGRRGTNFFSYTLRGWRLKDVYVMQVTKAIDLSYRNNIYHNQLNAKLVLQEHV